MRVTQFTDKSTATRTEKAKRFLRSLSSTHDPRYFYGDGYPRQDDILNDAAATLELLESLAN